MVDLSPIVAIDARGAGRCFLADAGAACARDRARAHDVDAMLVTCLATGGSLLKLSLDVGSVTRSQVDLDRGHCWPTNHLRAA